MGNLENKCLCFNGCDVGDKNLNECLNISTSSQFKKTSDDKINTEFMTSNGTRNSIYNNRKNNDANNNPHNHKENKFLNSLILLQAYIRGNHYRIQFHKIKQKLISQTRDIIDKYTTEYKTVQIFKAETLHGKFNKDGWKQFYGEDSSHLFNYDPNFFGILLNSSIHIYKDLSYYIGTVNIRNKRCGYGVMVTPEGAKYQGNWVNNKFTGWGRYINIDGTILEGNFINNSLNGRGEKYFLNSSSYCGEFRNSLKHGNGKEETLEHFYEGGFKSDKKEGKGKLSYKHADDSYEGEFYDNSIIGFGFYKWSNGDTFEGTFLNGKMHGKGVYKWPDGGHYIGDYVHNLKQGYGVFTWSNGKTYKGSFHNGKPDGIGIMIVDKESFDVEFKEGKIIKSVKIELNNGHIKDTQTNSLSKNHSFREKSLRSSLMKVQSSYNTTLSMTSRKKTG